MHFHFLVMDLKHIINIVGQRVHEKQAAENMIMIIPSSLMIMPHAPHLQKEVRSLIIISNYNQVHNEKSENADLCCNWHVFRREEEGFKSEKTIKELLQGLGRWLVSLSAQSSHTRWWARVWECSDAKGDEVITKNEKEAKSLAINRPAFSKKQQLERRPKFWTVASFMLQFQTSHTNACFSHSNSWLLFSFDS